MPELPAVDSPSELGQHSDRAAWASVVFSLKLLLFFNENGCIQDWMRWLKTDPLAWDRCTPHEQRLAMATALAWHRKHSSVDDLMADEFFLSSQLSLMLEEKRRARVVRGPFPTMWMGASDGAGSRL